MNNSTEPRGALHKETGDLAFAAYALVSGLRIIKARAWRNSGNGAAEYLFTLDDPDDKWEQLYVDFSNSEAAKYDAAVRNLKKLCKRGKESRK